MAGLAGGGPYGDGWAPAGANATPVYGGLAGQYQYTYAAPAPVAAAPTAAPVAVATPSTGPIEAPNETFATVAGTPIPVSGGRRRINLRIIDRIFRALNPDGSGGRIVMGSAGYPLFDVDNELSRVTANAITIYEGGVVTHPGVTSVTWYDGADDQIQDPTFTAKNGATLQPAHRGQMICVVDFNSLASWNGLEPALTVFIDDSIGGTLFAAWGGTWNPADKAADITLSGGDLIADNAGTSAGGGMQASVRGTVAHTAGRYTFSVLVNNVVTSGSGIALNTGSSNLDFYQGSQDGTSIRWDSDGFLYSGGVVGGVWPTYSDGDTVSFLVDISAGFVWGTKDWVTFYGDSGTPIPAADVAAGLHGFDISGLSVPLYPALTLASDADQATGIFDEDAPFGAAVGEPGDVLQADIIVATGVLSKLDESKIVVDASVDDREEGIIITNGISWVQYLQATGNIENWDFWEYGDTIQVKRVAFDSPAIDLDGIPLNHRCPVSDNGSTLSVAGAERAKAAVINLNYIDNTRQFQTSMVPARSEVPESAEEINITSPLVMSATTASLRANIALFKTEMESEQHDQCFPPIADYLALQPADVVRFASEGKTYTVKVKAVTLESDFLVRVEYNTLLSLAQDLIDDGRDGVAQFANAYSGEDPGQHNPQSPGDVAQRLFPMHLMTG